MEKFGIFELLDTLSALTAKQTPPAEDADAGTSPDAPVSPAHDAAYLPPVYGNGADAPQGDPEGAATPHADALKGFYARHNAIADRVEKKKN